MKKFIKNTIVFTIVVLSVAVAADFVISKGLRKTERGHFYTMNTLMNDSINADVVILGNSRVACSYRPSILDSILNVDSRNLGVSGQPFGVSCLRWHLYKRNNKYPKLLIINIDYGELEMVSNGYEKEQYYPYMHDSLVKPYLDLYGFSWTEKYIPMYRYRGDYKLMSIGLMELLNIRHDTKGDYEKGYSNPNSEWNGDKLNYVIQRGKVKDKSNPEVVELIRKIIEDAKRNKVGVVFVYAPLIKDLKNNLDDEKSMKAYIGLSERYNIPILDFSEMEICSDTSYFQDANHVNKKGADYFTLALAHRIDSLGLCR